MPAASASKRTIRPVKINLRYVNTLMPANRSIFIENFIIVSSEPQLRPDDAIRVFKTRQQVLDRGCYLAI
jgi:hypothetical protein